jgi:hypothetical protein
MLRCNDRCEAGFWVSHVDLLRTDRGPLFITLRTMSWHRANNA